VTGAEHQPQREDKLARLLIETKVRDYTSWRPAYDAHEPSRIEATITNGHVY
jgi:hypothetical protein